VVTELLRENAVLQRRIAAFMSVTEEGACDSLEGSAGIQLELLPPAILASRVRRLEAALQLEALERDDLELKVEAQRRVIAALTAKVGAT
jgi:hypothetical protein